MFIYIKLNLKFLKTNNDGVILVAYDVTDKREKTFLVNRIVKIYQQVRK